MLLLEFAGILIASHFLVLQIYRLSTYHMYFWPTLPLLIGFGAFVGWILYVLELHQFFIWQVVLASLWLFVSGRQHNRQAGDMLEMAGDDADAVRFMAESIRTTSRYYTYSSFVYVASIALTYLWLFNR